MSNKFEATAADGKVFKRTSAHRVYTHCVVIHIPAAPAYQSWLAHAAYDRAEWAGSRALAEKNASTWSKKPEYTVEILEARQVATASLPKISRAAEQRIADRIDGYDRDDLGESPDF